MTSRHVRKVRTDSAYPYDPPTRGGDSLQAKQSSLDLIPESRSKWDNEPETEPLDHGQFRDEFMHHIIA